MPGKGKERAVFADESDEDSVATDSTAESELLEEYGVERVLAELEEGGAKSYLLKWEGYPLGRSTWEPADNIIDESILGQWEDEKRRIAQGLAQPLDYLDWQAAAEDLENAKEDRRRRRKAKRRRRGIAVSPESDDNDEDEEDDNGHGPLFVQKRTRSPAEEAPTKARKRVKQPEVQRKGVAQRVKPNRRATRRPSSSSSEGEVSSAKSSGDDSLAEELASRNESNRPRKRLARARAEPEETSDEEESEEESPPPTKRGRLKKAGQANAPPPRTTPAGTAPDRAPAREPPAAARPIAAPKVSTATTSTKSASGATTTATSSAPKAKRTRQPDKVLGNWDAQKTGRQRPRISEATPKNSMDPKFQNLATQRRFQLYSRNEPAPDPSALQMVDPRTGKAKSPPTAVDGSTTSNIPNEYSRRSPPREKSPEQAVPERVRAGVDDATNARARARASSGRDQPPPQASTLTPAERMKQETCRYWIQGECHYNEETCRRAHRYTGKSTKTVTCFYWREQGRCSNSDEDCRFAHFDTGTYAPPPPGYQFPKERENSAARHSPQNEERPVFPKLSAAPEPPRTKKDITCYYWLDPARGCSKPEHVCEFAHRDTGNYAQRPPGALLRLDIPTQPANADLPTPTPTAAHRDIPSGRAGDVPTSQVTCYFWHNGGRCTKPDGVCKFAHRDTGIYAGQPGTFKRGQTSTGVASSANAVPVAIRNTVAPQSARSPGPPAAERRDGWMQQTVAQTRDFQESPMHLTDSPVHMADASPREQPTPTAQWRSLGAAMQRRASAPNFSMKATLVLSLQEEQQDEHISVKLDISDVSAFRGLAGSDPVLRVQQMVTSSDFEHLLWNEGLREAGHSSGGIFVDDNSIENITDVCKTHVAGLVASPDGHQSKMLLYPGNAEEWKFLDQGRELSSGCVLHFRLFGELPDSPPNESRLQAADFDERPAAQILGEDLVNLDTEVLFPAKELKKHPVRAVFLIVPPTRQAELAVLIKYFAALNCKVYHSGESGGWDYFRKSYSKSCAVIVHPDVQLWRIPGLYTFMSSHGAGVRMFSIGLNRTFAMLEDTKLEFSCERLFPHGTVIYITDDTFMNHPEIANDIFKAFINAHRLKPMGGETSRIAARPGIMDWLFKLAVSNTSERGRKDNRWMRLYNNVCRFALSDRDHDDSDDSEPPDTEPFYLITLSPDLLPALESLQQDGDQAGATQLAVDWFAGWSLLHANRFRKFVVCHGPKSSMNEDMMADEKLGSDPKGWAKKYQHMGVVPPKEALEMLTSRK